MTNSVELFKPVAGMEKVKTVIHSIEQSKAIYVTCFDLEVERRAYYEGGYQKGVELKRNDYLIAKTSLIDNHERREKALQTTIDIQANAIIDSNEIIEQLAEREKELIKEVEFFQDQVTQLHTQKGA